MKGSLNIGLLISGDLGYQMLKFLLKEDSQIEFICTDKSSLMIQNIASNKKIPIFLGNPRNGRIKNFIHSKNVQVLLSINYLFLIDQDLLSLAKYAVNIHGSLLPKYRGRTPHVWAIINNENTTGVTAHLIDLNCDTGPIISQMKVKIGTEDTGADILKKFEKIYPLLILDVLNKIQNSNLNLRNQEENLATYYGKRNPEDGLINWNWHKERLRNWVRAQAYPYPGSFTYYHGKKIIIDKICYSNLGFNYHEPNGLIININPLVVKTPNGSVEIVSYREKDLNFKKGEIFQNDENWK